MNTHPPIPDDERELALRNIVGDNIEAIVAAAKALSSDETTTSRLLALLVSERRVENRQAILYALSWHANPDTWDLMVRIFADASEDPKVRGQAAEALSYMFHLIRTDSKEFEAAVGVLLVGLKDPSPEVRYCAVNALGTTGHLPLAPSLRGMLEDRTPVPGWVGTVADEAARALDWLHLTQSSREKNRT